MLTKLVSNIYHFSCPLFFAVWLYWKKIWSTLSLPLQFLCLRKISEWKAPGQSFKKGKPYNVTHVFQSNLNDNGWFVCLFVFNFFFWGNGEDRFGEVVKNFGSFFFFLTLAAKWPSYAFNLCCHICLDLNWATRLFPKFDASRCIGNQPPFCCCWPGGANLKSDLRGWKHK